MPILDIPTATDPHYTQTTVLDGVEYLLRFQYNSRENAYYLSISDVTTGIDAISSIKLVSNYALIRRYAGMGGLPPGELVAMSNTTDDSPAGLGELGIDLRVTLRYFDAQYLATGV